MRTMHLGAIPSLDYACAESINTLATNITFSGSQYKSVMVTSCVANEGKSYISFHLARTLGNMGYRVVLVDADLRKSIFFSRYDVTVTGPRIGLTHFLAGRCKAEEAIYQVNLPNLCVVPTGKEVVNSLPLLTSTAFSGLLESFKRSFDFIIVDAPPVGLLIDAAMIASSCDATVLVVTNDISKRELTDAVAQIQKSKCTILGAVLNKVTMETHKSRKYYYKSYYSHYGSTYEYKGTDVDDKEPAEEAGAASEQPLRRQHAAVQKPAASGAVQPRANRPAASAPVTSTPVAHRVTQSSIAGTEAAKKLENPAAAVSGKTPMGVAPERRPGAEDARARDRAGA